MNPTTSISKSVRDAREKLEKLNREPRQILARGIQVGDDFDRIIFQLSGYFWRGDEERNVKASGARDEERARRILAVFDKFLSLLSYEREELWKRIREKCTWRKNKPVKHEHWYDSYDRWSVEGKQQAGNTRRRKEAFERIYKALEDFQKRTGSAPSLKKLSAIAKAHINTVKAALEDRRASFERQKKVSEPPKNQQDLGFVAGAIIESKLANSSSSLVNKLKEIFRKEEKKDSYSKPDTCTTLKQSASERSAGSSVDPVTSGMKSLAEEFGIVTTSLSALARQARDLYDEQQRCRAKSFAQNRQRLLNRPATC